MCAVLDELGIEGRERRAEIRGYWRAMANVEAEVQSEKRKRQEEERESKGEGADGQPKRPVRRR